MANALIDEAEEVQCYTAIGIERICHISGKKSYIPDVEEASKPKVGMIFASINNALAFYQRYARLGGFSVRKSAQYMKDEVIKLKYIVCTKEGFKTVKMVDSLVEGNKLKDSRKNPSKRTGCHAHIRLELCEQGRYRIYKFTEEHNHSFVDEEDYHFLPAARRMTYLRQRMVHGMSSINLGPVRAFNIMRTIYGGFEDVGATAVDCKNFKRDINLFIGEYDAEMVVQHLMRKMEYLPDFSCEYHTSDDGRLIGLFWADNDAKRNFFTFGDVISFDATYRSNRYNMVFVPFTGIDNHNMNVTLGAALLGSETTESYKWLLKAFKKNFGYEPQVVVTDQDPAMKKAIAEEFSNSRHRLCMWHVMNKLSEKVGARLCNSTDFKQRICDIVWVDSISIDEFEKEWASIISDFDLKDNNWLRDMFELRCDWIPAYYKHENMSGLMRTTSRSESENHFFGQVCNPKSTLVEFFSHFETAMEAQRHTHRKNDHDTRDTNQEKWTDFVLESQAAEIYTKTIFFDVRIEIHAACHKCCSATITPVGDFVKWSIRDFEQPEGLLFEVMFCPTDITVSCSCNRFEQFGLLCRHIFYVLRMCDVREFPKKYVLRRWTREAVPNSYSRSTITRGGNDDDNEAVHGVVREIMLANEYNVNRLVSNMDELRIYKDMVKGHMPKADAVMVVAPAPSKKDRLAFVTGMIQPSRAAVRVPVASRNKGCGSHKRIKSQREQAISQSEKKERKCVICKEVGHDSRNHEKFHSKPKPSEGASSSRIDTMRS